MLVVSKDAEKMLIDDLKACYKNAPTHRCLFLKCSQLEQDTNEWFGFVLDTLRNIIDEHTTRLYLCHDQDIFIVTQMLSRKQTDKFLSQLSPQLTPASLRKLAALFEIGIDCQRLITVAKRKYEALEIIKAKKNAPQKETIAKVCQDEMIQTLDRDLISSLAMRREMRETPEIMVVEDDPFSQKLIRNALKNKYEVSVTGDGQGALMNYVAKAPDVLFLDIGLPDIDGHEVLERLFKLDPSAYVVMFSGNGDKDNIMKAMRLGAKGFIGKPFTQEKLLQYIRKSPFVQAKQEQEKNYGSPA